MNWLDDGEDALSGGTEECVWPRQTIATSSPQGRSGSLLGSGSRMG